MSIYVDINMQSKPDKSKARSLIVPTTITSLVVGIWFLAVVISAHEEILAGLYQPLIALIVAATIAIPAVLYLIIAGFRDLVEAIGHRRIVLFHIWRIPAALLFFWYGFNGMLPPVFWILAGVGDLLVGIYALRLSRVVQEPAAYRKFHRAGFADFVVAVGTGLTFTLLMDARMAPVTALPLALIPLVGVGISGASHLMAFDMLKRGAGFGGAFPTSGTNSNFGLWRRIYRSWSAVAHTLDTSPGELLNDRIDALTKRIDALEIAGLSKQSR